MKRIGVVVTLLILILGMDGYCSTTSSGAEIKSPMIVTVFPCSTTAESYLIMVSEDGVIETLVGERISIEIDEDDYGSEAVDWFSTVESREKKILQPDEIERINELLNAIPFSTINSERTIMLDGWEKMLLVNSVPYYTYIGEIPSIGKLIDQVIEYSPIEVYIHGWA